MSRFCKAWGSCVRRILHRECEENYIVANLLADTATGHQPAKRLPEHVGVNVLFLLVAITLMTAAGNADWRE